VAAPESFIRARDVHLNVPVRGRRRRAVRGSPLAAVYHAFSRRRERQLSSLVRGISFDIPENSRVGLIGQNGAGKTTLLRLLAGALSPSSGELEVRGTTQNLLNVSMGMQPAATGMENIMLRGFSSGMAARDIKRLIPEILAFSELKSVINDPVQTYSAGMQLRLAFAVATSVKPEILLLDEWIGTGDRFFVERSKQRLLDHIDASKILVFASHNQEMLSELCSRGLVLKGGKIVFDSDIDEALEFYDSDEYEAA